LVPPWFCPFSLRVWAQHLRSTGFFSPVGLFPTCCRLPEGPVPPRGEGFRPSPLFSRRRLFLPSAGPRFFPTTSHPVSLVPPPPSGTGFLSLCRLNTPFHKRAIFASFLLSNSFFFLPALTFRVVIPPLFNFVHVSRTGHVVPILSPAGFLVRFFPPFLWHPLPPEKLRADELVPPFGLNNVFFFFFLHVLVFSGDSSFFPMIVSIFDR